MNGRQGRAVGGSCFGGVLGALLGVLIGGSVGAAMVEPPKKDERLPLTSGFFHFVGDLLQLGAVLVGAGVGGVAGAVGGSMVGVVIAAGRAGGESGSNCATNPTEELDVEAARLRARLDEIERQRE